MYTSWLRLFGGGAAPLLHTSPPTHPLSCHHSSRPPSLSPLPPFPFSTGHWLNLYGETLEEQLGEVQRLEARDRHAAAVVMLREVLECFTDVTRFPV